MTADRQNYEDFQQIKRTQRKNVLVAVGFASTLIVLTQAFAILSLVEYRKNIPIQNQLWILSQMSFIVQGMMVFYWLSKVPQYFSTDQYDKIKHYVFLALSCITGLFNFFTELEIFLLCPNSQFTSEEERNLYIDKIIQIKKEARNTSIAIFISFAMQLAFALTFFYQSSIFSAYSILLLSFSTLSMAILAIKTLPQILYFSELPQAILASAPSLSSTPKSLNDEEFHKKQKELKQLSIWRTLANKQFFEGVVSIFNRIVGIILISSVSSELQSKYLFIVLISYGLIVIFGIYEVWFNYCVQLPNFSKFQKICITLLISINGLELAMSILHTMKFKKCTEFKKKMKKMKIGHQVGMLFFQNALMITYAFLAKQQFEDQLTQLFDSILNLAFSTNFANNPLSLLVTFILETCCKCTPCCICYGSQCYCCRCCMCSCCKCCDCCACCCCRGEPEIISSAQRILSDQNSINNIIQVQQIVVNGTGSVGAQEISSIQQISNDP